MRHGPALLLALLTLLLAPGGAAAQSSADAALKRTLSQNMAGAGSSSGAYVMNADERRVLFSRRSNTPRVLASNTKIFTAAAALDRFGEAGTLSTQVLGNGVLEEDGTWRGDLYLRGGGDPTFGTASFNRRNYPSAPTAEQLADLVAHAGVRRVTGRVYGDESRFDSRRGGPYSGYGTSIYVGPVSALSWNRGFANERGSAFQANPPAFAAAHFDALLERRGIAVSGRPSAGTTPAGSLKLAQVESPPMHLLVRLMMKPSDNFFAEMLLKRLARAPASTRAGTVIARRHASSLGARVRLSDGSGLASGNRASPRAVGRTLDALRSRDEFPAFQSALPIAGRDGTLRDRMRRGPARGRCRAKTGTLNGVSALSGYCRTLGRDTIVFSFLMNRVSPIGARALQDRMTQAIARYRG